MRVFFQAPDKLRSNELSDGQEIGTLADNSLTIMDTKDGLTIAGTTIFHFFREISLLIFCVHEKILKFQAPSSLPVD